MCAAHQMSPHRNGPGAAGEGAIRFTTDELEEALATVRRAVPPTPQHVWPLLAARTGCELVVKHENHTPIGAFKVRGGLVYLSRRLRRDGVPQGIVGATRGNHGQSLAFAGRHFGVPVTIVVPHGNSREKNAAMRAFGAELVEAGADFDEAKEVAQRLARERGLHMAPSFHRDLVLGVATYAWELFRAHADLDAVYAPIGLGSGICGLVTVRDLLGLRTRIVGVVSRRLPAYARSFAAGRPVATGPAETIADGMAVRVPDAEALGVILRGVERIVEVEEEEIAAAMRHYWTDTHNLAEGAGAAPLAALLQERGRMRGRRIGLVLSGGNVDLAWFRRLLETTDEPGSAAAAARG